MKDGLPVANFRSMLRLAAASSKEYEPLGMPHIARRAYDAASLDFRRRQSKLVQSNR